MKIAYDATTLGLTKGGTSVYFRNLIENLKIIEPENEYNLYSTNFIGKKNFLIKKVETLYREFLWRDNILPRMASNNKSDIIHFPNQISTLKSKIPTVVSIHDIYILKNPDAFPFVQVKRAQYMLPRVLRTATKIMALSHFTKNEILNYINIDEKKIKVVYPGASKLFKPVKDKDRLKQITHKYKLPEKFILYVGAIEPRKNVDKLIGAFDIVRKSVDISLVIVSFGGWKNKNVYNTVKNSPNFKHIHLVGYVSDEDLPVIYGLANMFVYPSMYEGFGLPLLEAMSCGCPVIGTQNTVADEVLGNSGILTESLDIDQLASAIFYLSKENNRLKYKNLGLQRSSKFTWKKCAKETLELYQTVVQ